METKVLEYRLPIENLEKDLNNYSVNGWEIKSTTTYIDSISEHYGMKVIMKLIIILQRNL